MVIRFHCFRDYYSLLFLPDTIKFVDMRRQSWLSAFIVFKTIKVFFSFQRQSSPLARREKLWSFAPLPFRDYYGLLLSIQRQSSPMARRGKYGHLLSLSKTQMSFDQDYFSLLCQPETSEFIGTRRQIMVIYHFCNSEIIESDNTQRQIWSSAPFCQDSNVFRLRLF